MHESIITPAYFSSDDRSDDDPAVIAKAGQSVFMSIYQTKIAGQCRFITITWCKNLLLHGLSVSIEGENYRRCKVELKPWYFWRKHGSKQFEVDGKIVGVIWDLKNAKFNGEIEPRSDYYVAIVCEAEVVLLVGDLKKNAFQKTRCRPALIDPILVSRKEHIFGKRKFSTRVKFHELEERFHDISIECINSLGGDIDPQMEIRIDGRLAIHVKHLQWKFRGNESIIVSKLIRVEVYWDVHDWLFSSGPRSGLFIFKPNSSSSSSASLAQTIPTTSLGSILMSTKHEDCNAETGSSKFCLFIYAWKIE